MRIGIVLIAAWSDVATRTISNKLVGLLVFVGFAAHVEDGHFLGSLFAGTCIFFVGAWCWRRGWMGGGDVKLLAACALGVSPQIVPSFILAVALAGGLLGVLYLIARPVVSLSKESRSVGVVGRVLRAERWRLRRGCPLPYACAIAAGLLFISFRGPIL